MKIEWYLFLYLEIFALSQYARLHNVFLLSFPSITIM